MKGSRAASANETDCRRANGWLHATARQTRTFANSSNRSSANSFPLRGKIVIASCSRPSRTPSICSSTTNRAGLRGHPALLADTPAKAPALRALSRTANQRRATRSRVSRQWRAPLALPRQPASRSREPPRRKATAGVSQANRFRGALE